MDPDYKEMIKKYKPQVYGGRKESAVLLPLIKVDDEWHILYEVRSDLVSQAGDSSFPGGRVEKNENFEEAAIRETMEELNIARENIKVLGEMDYIISKNLIIRCFVGELIGLEVSDISPNQEVEQVYTVPVEFLITNPPQYFTVNFNPALDEEFLRSLGKEEFEYEFREHTDKVPVYEVEKHSLWGYTANLTERFIEIIQGEDLEEANNIG